MKSNPQTKERSSNKLYLYIQKQIRELEYLSKKKVFNLNFLDMSHLPKMYSGQPIYILYIL